MAAAQNLPSSSDPAASFKVPATANLTAQIEFIAHQEEVARPHEHAESIIPPIAAAEEHAAVALEDMERMAMANNPTLVQANAQVQAEHGAAYQAGLRFNPVIGYASEQIGVNGTAGELQDGFVSQEIVTGGKLRLSRAKWAQRAQIAETNLLAQQQRVLNDLRAYPSNNVLVGVAQVREVEFIANNPGDWAVHCHIFHHMMNSMTSQAGPLIRNNSTPEQLKVLGYPQVMMM